MTPEDVKSAFGALKQVESANYDLGFIDNADSLRSLFDNLSWIELRPEGKELRKEILDLIRKAAEARLKVAIKSSRSCHVKI